MTFPVPRTDLPDDQLTHTILNTGNGLKGIQNAAFNLPRAKLIYTGAGSSVTGAQPLAVAFGAGVGSAVYDNAFDGSTMTDGSSRRGFQIQISGMYRIQARWAWVDNVSATSGLRYLGLYQQFQTFTSGGSAIGSGLAGISNDPSALRWDIGRRVASTPPTPRIDIELPMLKGMCLQLGVCQNSTVSPLAWLTGGQFCWFTCHMLAPLGGN